MIGQKLIPYKGINSDVDPLYVDEQTSPLLKNITYDVNNSGTGSGANVGVFTPLEGNEPYCNGLALPRGVNLCCGSFPVRETNHTYICVWNSKKDHFIYRLNGTNGTCEMVSMSPFWNFQRKPENFISPGRITAQVTCRFNKITGQQEKVTYLLITDNYNPIRFICVEDCIATQTFTLPYSYFGTPDENWISLGVPKPIKCVSFEAINRDLSDAAEKLKPNRLNFKGWQFRVKDTNMWSQDSEHGDISNEYITVTGNSCIENSSGLSRCLWLYFDGSSPLIDKKQIEFRNCNGKAIGLSIDTDWFLYDTIDLYEQCDNVNWWERVRANPWKKEYDKQILAGKTDQEATEISDNLGLLKYDASSNTYRYTFCGDKQWTPVPVSETNRTQNLIPTTASSIFSIYKNIGTARHNRGFSPFDCNLLNKVSYGVIPPTAEDISCKSVLRKITIFGVIYNPWQEAIQRIRRDGDNVVFGQADKVVNYQQYFAKTVDGNQEGFPGYLAGTKNFCLSKQKSYNKTTGELLDVGVDGTIGVSGGFGTIYLDIIPVQVWEFYVIPGTYVFRIGSHRALLTSDYQKTSTNTAGRTVLTNVGSIFSDSKEVVIDCSAGDVEIKDNPFMIYDLCYNAGTLRGGWTSVVTGYMYEDQVEKRPIEKAFAERNTGNGAESITTDHNGFYFISTLKEGLRARLFGRKAGAYAQLALGSLTSDSSGGASHFVEDKLYAYTGTDNYNNNDRILVKGRISLCGNANVGIAGALVILTNGATATADNNGNFTIIAHDKYDGTGRTEKVIYGQRGICQLIDCNTTVCTYSFLQPNAVLPVYTGAERIVTIAELTVRIKGLNKRGPQMGGRYSMGIWGHDWLGRHGFIQRTDKDVVNIPTLQETQVFDYSLITWALANDIVFPKWVKRISFGITDNLNQEDFLTWVAERVQFVDNTGQENKEAPTQIRLYYESLGEFNKQNAFSTTTSWQFILQDEAPVIGDQIEFLANGDGKLFSSRTTTLVQYDKFGKYISVEYSDDLKGLLDGALIKLIRPRQSETKQFYYELCPSIAINKNGRPDVYSGTFNFFDSYLMNRQIPVPIAKKKSKDQYGTEITTDENVNELKTYPFLFEHHSPSDKWGDHCHTRGRVNVTNPFENQQCLPTQIAISKALANDGLINGLHYFVEEDMKEFDENEFGGIVVVLPELNYLMCLCEQDNFVVGYQDDQVRVGQGGRIVAPSADNKFGRPERKIGSNYGCQLKDINTIQKYDGLVYFLDRTKSALLMHNFSEAKDVSENGFTAWLSLKIRTVINDPSRYFVSIIDPNRKEYLLTTHNIKDAYKLTDFVNDHPYEDANRNETVAVDIYTGIMRAHYSFIPEYYAIIEGDRADQQLIGIMQGKAYKHYNTSRPYNNFFGIQCKPRIWAVANRENTKVKKFQCAEVYCPQVQFIAYDVVTEAKQKSRILTKWWEKRETFWAGAFLCDINTFYNPNIPKETSVNKITDGDLLYGRWLKVGLTTIKEDDGKYFEYTAAIIFMLASEKSSDVSQP